METTVLILAGGMGTRMGFDYPKQFIPLGKWSVLHHAIDRFHSHPGIESILVVSHPDYAEETRSVVRLGGFKKVRAIVPGGARRQASAYLGLQAIRPPYPRLVLIHDAARPLVSHFLIDRVLDALKGSSAVVPVIPVPDTLLEVSEGMQVVNVMDRNRLRGAQTPQGFEFKMIREAHRFADEQGVDWATDDASLVLHFKLAEVHCIEGDETNIKLSRPLDLKTAEQVLLEPGEVNDR